MQGRVVVGYQGPTSSSGYCWLMAKRVGVAPELAGPWLATSSSAVGVKMGEEIESLSSFFFVKELNDLLALSTYMAEFSLNWLIAGKSKVAFFKIRSKAV